MSNKIAIVANRLPVVVSKKAGKFHFTPSDGGLASALSSAKVKGSVWVGWPGIAKDDLTKSDMEEIEAGLLERDCKPVFLTQKQIDKYYSGYCNDMLWPLFHYFADKANFSEKNWQVYQEVNELFAKAAGSVGADVVWVHDYQLMLVPAQLRVINRSLKIGFFLHIPFPSFEVFRLIPERKVLLEGILGADLIGFHTYDYAKHFLSSCLQIMGYENNLGIFEFSSRRIKVDAFPIGIDYRKFSRAVSSGSKKDVAGLFDIASYEGKIVASLDRLDYSKGILARLDAIEHFLENNNVGGAVKFVMLAIPSRSEVGSYKELKKSVEQRIRAINRKYVKAIHYLYRSLEFEQTRAFYDLADVMLVTPLRDGMNLVAKEYVATKRNGGMLVLSDMPGVARELIEAEMVNPNDTRLTSESIKKVLEMKLSQQKELMGAMKKRVADYQASRWANDFIQELEKAGLSLLYNNSMIDEGISKKIAVDYKTAKKRLILLDYDGTLRGFVPSPDPKMAQPSSELREILAKITADKNNRVAIISGRSKEAMQLFFDDKNLEMVAEHGGWHFKGGKWKKGEVGSMEWKDRVRPVLEKYASRTPGSLVEEKYFALVWHYRRSDPELAHMRGEEIKMELGHVLGSDSLVGVFEGQKIIEVKPKLLHKGALVSEMVGEETWDFILSAGDDYTDEDMFKALPKLAYTVKVGDKETVARFRVATVDDMVDLLGKLG